MITSEIKTKHPITYQILNNVFTKNAISHAYLIVGYNRLEIAKFIAKSIYCESNILACGQCEDCIKIEEGIKIDYTFIDGSEHTVKKGEIESLQYNFNKSALEGTKKVYIIHNIENSTKEAMNSLLKFLEEPIDNVYAIFTATQASSVLPTIVSRCLLLSLEKPTKESIRKELIDNKAAEEESLLLPSLFNDIATAVENIDSEQIQLIKNEIYNIIDDLFFNPDNVIINMHIHINKQFKTNEELSIVLRIMYIAFKDLFHVKHSLPVILKSYGSL